VFLANKYFSTDWGTLDERKLRLLPEDLVYREKELGAKTDRSEMILETETDKSIIYSNSIANKFAADIGNIKGELGELHKYKPLFDRMTLLIKPETFIGCLKDFSVALQKNYHKVFWDIKKDKLIQSPEKNAQSHLGIFLEGRFGGIAFVGKEIIAGNGFIDLFVHFFGVQYIVEIKIVGNGWSIQSAEKGLPQLDAYMHAFNKTEAYLVVLDGRRTDGGRQLKEKYELDYGTVNVITSKIRWRRASS
jgi:hypothetical protein